MHAHKLEARIHTHTRTCAYTCTCTQESKQANTQKQPNTRWTSDMWEWLWMCSEQQRYLWSLIFRCYSSDDMIAGNVQCMVSLFSPAVRPATALQGHAMLQKAKCTLAYRRIMQSCKTPILTYTSTFIYLYAYVYLYTHIYIYANSYIYI